MFTKYDYKVYDYNYYLLFIQINHVTFKMCQRNGK